MDSLKLLMIDFGVGDYEVDNFTRFVDEMLKTEGVDISTKPATLYYQRTGVLDYYNEDKEVLLDAFDEWSEREVLKHNICTAWGTLLDDPRQWWTNKLNLVRKW